MNFRTSIQCVKGYANIGSTYQKKYFSSKNLNISSLAILTNLLIVVFQKSLLAIFFIKLTDSSAHIVSPKSYWDIIGKWIITLRKSTQSELLFISSAKIHHSIKFFTYAKVTQFDSVWLRSHILSQVSQWNFSNFWKLTLKLFKNEGSLVDISLSFVTIFAICYRF